MAIVTKSLFKGEIQLDGEAGLAEVIDIYQVPANKRALIKHFHFYITLNTMGAGDDAWIVITDSADNELVRIWWTTDANALGVAADDTGFIFLTTEDTDSHQNIVLESQQKIRFAHVGDTGEDMDIRVDISGAEEDV